MKKLARILPPSLLLLPFVVSAQQDVQGVVRTITDIINAIVPLMIGVAFLVFIYGVISYVLAGGDDKKTSTARQTMIYGIIGLAVILGAWGIVAIILNTIGVDAGRGPIIDFRFR